MPAPTQPEPAEGARDGDDAVAKPSNQGRSAEEPAEGADSSAAPLPGSPQG